jgi:UDP-N-acetylmuramate-alanine ligase
MGRIVTNGRAQPVLTTRNPPNAATWQRRTLKVGHGGRQFSFYGKSIAQLEANLNTLHEHFGVNRTAAVKIALHLTAQAIRHNRARPAV